MLNPCETFLAVLSGTHPGLISLSPHELLTAISPVFLL